MHDPRGVHRLESGQAVIEDNQSRGGRQRPGDTYKVAERDAVHRLADNRGSMVVEGDHGEEVLMAQCAEHAHVVANLTAEGAIRRERRAEQADAHGRTSRDVACGDDRAGSVDADPPIQEVTGDARA